MKRFVFYDQNLEKHYAKDTTPTQEREDIRREIEEDATLSDEIARLLCDYLHGVGITDKPAFDRLWKRGAINKKNPILSQCLKVDAEKVNKQINYLKDAIKTAKNARIYSFWIYTAICLRLQIGAGFDFRKYALNALDNADGDTINLESYDAVKVEEYQQITAKVLEIAKGLPSLSNEKAKRKAQGDAPKADAQGENVQASTPGDTNKADAQPVEILETPGKERGQTTPVSYDFYKILEVVKVDEKTKQILEFLALSFGDKMRELQKANPTLKAEQKAEIIKHGDGWTIPENLVKPIILTPKEWAGRLYPDYMKERGVTKAIIKTLTAFAPLQNATIVRECIDEKTGQLVKRVTPVFMIEYDFKDGTPDDVINKFRSNPLEFLKNEEPGAENLINIRVRPSAPLITNQYNDVSGGDIWRKYILAEKNEDKTKGARRLGVLNVPKVKADKILKVEEMAVRTRKYKSEQMALYGDIAELANKVYGTNYHHDAKGNNFVDTTKTEEKPKKTEAKPKAETTTRPARKTKGRGRPKKEK